MFDHIGIAHRIDELREVCPGNLFFFKGLDAHEMNQPMLDFRKLEGTRYNYYGKINQNDLDRTLRENLASYYDVRPDFGCTYCGHVEEGGLVTVEMQHEDGRTEFARTRWLVGADGSRSSVRTHIGGQFEQKSDETMTMSMVDAKISSFKGDRSWVNYFVAAKGFMLVTGLPGDKYRLYLAGELEEYLKENEPKEAFQRGLDFFETGATIESLEWSSTWPIRKIVGEFYQRGKVLLCGDATHVHSPAGGQGMNACMQDAFNLGWKLSLVIRGAANPEILGTYERERKPIAEQVTEGADRMHQVLFNAKLGIEDRFRLTQDPHWHEEAIRRISGISHNYRGVDGVAGEGLVDAQGLEPGDRAPDLILSQNAPQLRVYDLCRHGGFTLLIFPGDKAAAAGTASEIASAVSGTYGPLVKCIAVCRDAIPGFDTDHLAVDREDAVARVYGLDDGTGLALIRPDLFLGFRGALADSAALLGYLGTWLCSAIDASAEAA
ncbi:MAG: Pentachlorophenol monooxygenase [Bradyrhizobium sp.]|nr:Pentachlorophenol monooxygenase [Bradyrhizobium sp.]